MAESVLSTNVEGKSEITDSLIVLKSELERLQVSSAASFNFYFHICNSKTFETIADTEPVTIDTSITGLYSQKDDNSGEVLFNTPDVKIVKKGFSKSDDFWSDGIQIYIENNSDVDLIVQMRDTSINNISMSSYLSEDVLAGRKSITSIKFPKTDLSSNKIDKLETISFTFHIANKDDWSTIYSSDLITVNYN